MSAAALHLVVATPARVLVDAPGVLALRGEDASGAFGLLPGHVDFLTALAPSVLRWRDAAGPHYCAVHGGVLSLERGTELRVACREGVLGDDLATLQASVAAARERARDADRRARVEQLRLQTRIVRQLVRSLQPPRARAAGLGLGLGLGAYERSGDGVA
ncbi:MAG TPA: F0F1 ATP synthase subunit epsilon [Dokdonella sp.]